MTIWIGVIFLIAASASASEKQCIAPVYCTEASGPYPGWMQVYPALQCVSDLKYAFIQGEPKIYKNSEIPFINVTELKAELLNMSQSNAILLEKYEKFTAMVELLNGNNSKLSEKIDRLNENNTKLTKMLDSLNKNDTKLYERNAELAKELELQATTNAKQTGKNALLEAIGSKIDYQGKVRLVNGSSLKNGRVEVLYNGTWGTVCDDKWEGTTGKHNADVVCNQLGFRRSTWYKVDGDRDLRYGTGTGKIWLDDVECTGSDNFFPDCPHEPWGTHDCNHDEDVAVVCE